MNWNGISVWEIKLFYCFSWLVDDLESAFGVTDIWKYFQILFPKLLYFLIIQLVSEKQTERKIRIGREVNSERQFAIFQTWVFGCFEAYWQSIRVALLFLSWSINTSNSSKHRIGDLIRSQRANRNATVVMLLSPPLSWQTLSFDFRARVSS